MFVSTILNMMQTIRNHILTLFKVCLSLLLSTWHAAWNGSCGNHKIMKIFKMSKVLDDLKIWRHTTAQKNNTNYPSKNFTMLADPKAYLNTHAGHVTRKANKLKEILEENPTLTSVTSKESNSTANEGKRQFNRSNIYYLNIVPIVNDSF